MNVLSVFLIALVLQSGSSIQGVVIKPGTNEPVSKAVVELRKDNNDPLPYTSVSGSDGRFEFRNVPPGEYQLTVKRSGYVPGIGETVRIAPGGAAPNIRIVLTPTGVISGRIYDRQGKVAANIDVYAMKVSYSQGRRSLRRVQAGITNDLGEYRLFGLSPGEYFVGAFSSTGDIRPLVYGNQGTDPVFDVKGRLELATAQVPPTTDIAATSYFPGTFEADAASPIALKAGGDIRGIDFAIASMRANRIRGVVVNADTGQPVQGPVQILIAGTPSTRMMPAAANPFDLGSYSPGSYTMMVNAGALVGRTNVEVTNRDVDVTAMVTSGFSIPGKVFIEGASSANPAPALTSLRVALRVDPNVAPGPAAATPAADGAFTIRAVPSGNYRVSVTPALNGFVKSIRLGETDVLNPGLHLETQPSSQLAIVINLNPGLLNGVVLNARQQPVSKATVAMIPESAFRTRTDLFKSAITDDSGKFEFKALTPGNYTVFAWEEVEPGAWQNEEFMKTFENRGKTVHINEGSSETLTLPVIPPG